MDRRAVARRGLRAGEPTRLDAPIGDLNWQGLDGFTEADFRDAMSIDRNDWNKEILAHDELFIRLNDRIPREMVAIRDLTLSALWRSPQHWEMNADPT